MQLDDADFSQMGHLARELADALDEDFATMGEELDDWLSRKKKEKSALEVGELAWEVEKIETGCSEVPQHIMRVNLRSIILHDYAVQRADLKGNMHVATVMPRGVESHNISGHEIERES